MLKLQVAQILQDRYLRKSTYKILPSARIQRSRLARGSLKSCHDGLELQEVGREGGLDSNTLSILFGDSEQVPSCY